MWVYVDITGRIVAASNEIMDGTTGWRELPGFPGPEFDARGIPLYAYVPDGSPAWRERTQEEMDADYVEPPAPPKSNEELQAENELLRAQVQSLADRGEFIEDCIAEMAMQVYQ